MILSIARREVITAHADDGVRDLAGKMRYYNVGCVVVVHGDKPAGIVTDRDLALRVLGEDGRDADGLKASDVMTRSPQTVREDDGIEKALDIMRSAGVRRLPVVDRKGKLRGLVSLDDVVESLCGGFDAIAGVVERQQKPSRRSGPARHKKAAG